MAWERRSKAVVGMVAILWSWLHGIAAANSNSTFTCSLNCENGGYCEYVTGSDAELQVKLQSGVLIMQCICPETYTGLGCEQERPVCDMNTLKCPNGMPCDPDPSNATRYHCDCSMADAISHRASQFCRRTYTEYCFSSSSNNQWKRDAAMGLAFCTNGGKCKADIIAAREAPWNTTANALYEQAGCNCPAEYYGPHCEFLHHALPVPSETKAPVIENIATTEPTETMAPSVVDTQSLEDLIGGFDNATRDDASSSSSSSEEESSSALRATLIGVLLAVGVVCTTLGVLTYRHRRNKQRRMILMRRLSNAPPPPSLDEHDDPPPVPPQTLALKKKTKKMVQKPKKTKKLIQLKPALSADDQDIVSLSAHDDPYLQQQQQHSLVPFVVEEEDEPTSSTSLWNDDPATAVEKDPLSAVAGDALLRPPSSSNPSQWSARVTNLAAKVAGRPSWQRSHDETIYVVEEDEDDEPHNPLPV